MTRFVFLPVYLRSSTVGILNLVLCSFFYRQLPVAVVDAMLVAESG